MKKILITGYAGQIGSELTEFLVNKHGRESVIGSDIKKPESDLISLCEFETIDVTNYAQIEGVIKKYDIGTIYHLAAILSAVGEHKPQLAWTVNVNGLFNMLELSRIYNCSLFTPSSIGAFGPSTPADKTPQDTIQRPTSIYGVTKVSGELLCDYYFQRFAVDTRGVRFPGLISYLTPPGGGTTDYAVDIFYEAIKKKQYTCFLRGDTRMDMMYMPDAIKACVNLMEADPVSLKHRNAFNVTAMSFTPEEIASEIRKHIPEFTIDYKIDPVRQGIADSWPNSLDDSAAREQWRWNPTYNLTSMTKDMIEKLSEKLKV